MARNVRVDALLWICECGRRGFYWSRDAARARRRVTTSRIQTAGVLLRSNSFPRCSRRSAAAFACVLSLMAVFSRPAVAQVTNHCGTDRTVSTLVGAGLGGVAAAIPATIVHRHDQTSSYRIVAVSVSAGAVIGFVAAGRDRPCTSSADSAHIGAMVVARRSAHAANGALTGALIGAVAGAAGSMLYNVDCTGDPCNLNSRRASIAAFSAGEGALAVGILGGLIGWAWPVHR
jgi:hypothetical protein